MQQTIKVAVLIYPGVELVDMNGPVDTFLKANMYNQGRYQIFTVAESAEAIKSEGAVVTVIPDYTLDNCPQADIIVIPGQVMPVGSPEMFGSGSDALIGWLQAQAKQEGIIIMSICVGAFILAKTGLLDGKKATTHWAAMASIQQQYPAIAFVQNVRFVRDGNFVSTGGITSGIDGALSLVSTLDSPAIALETADIMVYNTNAPLPPGTILL